MMDKVVSSAAGAVNDIADGSSVGILERAITTDFALIRAHQADLMGNLRFRGGGRNFNVSFAKAARMAIAEVDEIVDVGELGPDEIDLPGGTTQPRLELHRRPPRRPAQRERDPQLRPHHLRNGLRSGCPRRERLLHRTAAGGLVLRQRHVVRDRAVGSPRRGRPRRVPGGRQRRSGQLGQARPKLVPRCEFPLTAPSCVDTIVTDLALLTRDGDGFRLDEVARGFTVDEVLTLTGMPVSVATTVGVMQERW
jgi:hypothetical protein